MFEAKKQVEESHYDFTQYVNKPRWVSYYHQINECLLAKPNNALLIGSGDGIVANILREQNISVTTVDIDPDLSPTIVASVDDLPFPDNYFDVCIACQVLEHMPYGASLKGLSELSRVCNNTLIISLPDQKPCRQFHLSFPYMRQLKFLVPQLFYTPKEHLFDGEHYWELNAKGYSVGLFMEYINQIKSNQTPKHYRVFENPYHHFFIIRGIQ